MLDRLSHPGDSPETIAEANEFAQRSDSDDLLALRPAPQEEVLEKVKLFLRKEIDSLSVEEQGLLASFLIDEWRCAIADVAPLLQRTPVWVRVNRHRVLRKYPCADLSEQTYGGQLDCAHRRGKRICDALIHRSVSACGTVSFGDFSRKTVEAER